MKKILIILMCCFTFIAVQAQEQKTKQYPLFADGVVEFGHIVDEDIYYLIYHDEVNFPTDPVVYDEWREETYISIECTQDDFFEYLAWFSEERTKKSKDFFKESNKYAILEVITPVEGGLNYRYKLVKKPVNLTQLK